MGRLSDGIPPIVWIYLVALGRYSASDVFLRLNAAGPNFRLAVFQDQSPSFGGQIERGRLTPDGLRAYFATRSQVNVLSTTGALSSPVSIRNDMRLVRWNVYHRLVALPTALGFLLIS